LAKERVYSTVHGRASDSVILDAIVFVHVHINLLSSQRTVYLEAKAAIVFLLVISTPCTHRLSHLQQKRKRDTFWEIWCCESTIIGKAYQGDFIAVAAAGGGRQHKAPTGAEINKHTWAP
jgi:hypothetical protein